MQTFSVYVAVLSTLLMRLSLTDAVTITTARSTPAPRTAPSYTDACGSPYFGQTFYVAFMQTDPSLTLNMVLWAGQAATADTSVQVTLISASPLASTSSVFNVPFTISGFRPVTVQIPAQFQLTGSSLQQSTSTFYVSASSSLTVIAFYEQSNACDGVLILPLTSLGTTYFAASLAPNPAGVALTQLAIVGTRDATTVTVTIPSGVRLFNLTAPSGSLQFTVDSNRVVQLQFSTDLTGTQIVSSAPVAVFSGNLNTTQGTDLLLPIGTAAQQMMPASAAGLDFAVAAPLPDEVLGQYAVKVIATQANTRVNITDQSGFASQLTLASPGSQVTSNYFFTEYVRVQASSPVLVLQQTYEDFPAMTIIPAISEYLSVYSFVVPVANTQLFGNYLIVVAAANSIGNLMLDTAALSPVIPWAAIPGDNPSLRVTYVTVTAGYHFLYSTDKSGFFATVFGQSKVCDYWYPVGMCLASFTGTVSSSSASSTAATSTSSAPTSTSTSGAPTSTTTGSSPTSTSTATTTTTSPLASPSTSTTRTTRQTPPPTSTSVPSSSTSTTVSTIPSTTTTTATSTATSPTTTSTATSTSSSTSTATSTVPSTTTTTATTTSTAGLPTTTTTSTSTSTTTSPSTSRELRTTPHPSTSSTTQSDSSSMSSSDGSTSSSERTRRTTPPLSSTTTSISTSSSATASSSASTIPTTTTTTTASASVSSTTESSSSSSRSPRPTPALSTSTTTSVPSTTTSSTSLSSSTMTIPTTTTTTTVPSTSSSTATSTSSTTASTSSMTVPTTTTTVPSTSPSTSSSPSSTISTTLVTTPGPPTTLPTTPGPFLSSSTTVSSSVASISTEIPTSSVSSTVSSSSPSSITMITTSIPQQPSSSTTSVSSSVAPSSTVSASSSSTVIGVTTSIPQQPSSSTSMLTTPGPPLSSSTSASSSVSSSLASSSTVSASSSSTVIVVTTSIPQQPSSSSSMLTTPGPPLSSSTSSTVSSGSSTVVGLSTSIPQTSSTLPTTPGPLTPTTSSATVSTTLTSTLGTQIPTSVSSLGSTPSGPSTAIPTSSSTAPSGSTPASPTTTGSTTPTTLSTTLAFDRVQALTAEDCLTLSSAIQPNVSGNYYRLSPTVYQRTDLELYIYLFSDLTNNYQFWAVGPTVGVPRAFLTNANMAVAPPSTDWYAYNWTTWVPDRVSLSSGCTIPKASTTCYTVEFFFNSGSPANFGPFTYTGRLSSGRPIYYNADLNLNLYYTAGGSWVVGQEIGLSSGLFTTLSQQLYVPVGQGVQWRDNQGSVLPIYLQCYQMLI